MVRRSVGVAKKGVLPMGAGWVEPVEIGVSDIQQPCRFRCTTKNGVLVNHKRTFEHIVSIVALHYPFYNSFRYNSSIPPLHLY